MASTVWTFGPGGVYTATWDGVSVVTVTMTSGGAFQASFTGATSLAAAQALATGFVVSPAVTGLSQGGTGVSASSAAGLLASLGAVPQDPWLPADNGLLAASGDLDAYLSTTTGALTAGTVYLAKVMIRQAITPGHVVVGIGAAGSGASTGSFVGVYSSSGAQLAVSADIGASLASAPAAPLLALTSSPSLAAGSFVWVAFVVNLASTQPSLYRNGGAGTLAVSNAGLTAATFRYAVNGTGLSALPGSITPGSNTATGAYPAWMGLAA